MKKPRFALILVTVAFCGVILGIYIGRNSTQNYAKVANTTHYLHNQSETNSSDYEASSFKSDDKSGLININSASKSQLMLLPGIGEVLAQRIIDYRDAFGSFSCVEDLTLVEGIGDVKLAEVIEYITVGG